MVPTWCNRDSQSSEESNILCVKSSRRYKGSFSLCFRYFHFVIDHQIHNFIPGVVIARSPRGCIVTGWAGYLSSGCMIMGVDGWIIKANGGVVRAAGVAMVSERWCRPIIEYWCTICDGLSSAVDEDRVFSLVFY